jgi:hypothetical protein
VLNCPACGHEVPEYGRSETWRDAAKRWRDYARRLEELLDAIEHNNPTSTTWKNVADERAYLLRVAEAKLEGKPVPPQPSDKGIVEREPQCAKTLRASNRKETTTDQPN